MDHSFEQNCTVSYTVLGPNTRGPDHHYEIDVCASAEELQQFDREGYLVREGLFCGRGLESIARCAGSVGGSGTRRVSRYWQAVLGGGFRGI